MAINFTIGNLTNDQTAGTQTTGTTDTGNDVNVTLDGSSNLDGLDTGFETFLAGLGLSSAQKNFAANVDGASSGSTFIQVSATAGEAINDLKLVANSTTATGWTTLAGDPLYLHVSANGNYATLTTATGSGGTIVAAFALTNETINNTTHTATAGVQMVTFAPINHPVATNADDTLALGDVLKVAVDTATSFNFSQLDAGNFLWAAVGSASSAMLITGQDLNVIDSGGKLGEKVNSGSTDPTDTVNTSKATGTTIGINAQHFAPTNTGDGATGVFTFVQGLAPLELASPQYTGQNITQIDYDNYINVTSASVSISQLTGGTSAKLEISLWEAGGGGSADHLTTALLPEEGYNANSNNKYSYIGDQNTDSNLKDDTPVGVATVTVRGFTWDSSTSGTLHNGVTVTITGNSIIVDGAHANDLISFTAVDDPNNSLDGTFNRLNIQALSGSAAFDIGQIALTSGGTTSADLGSHLFVDDDGPKITAQANPADNDLQVGNVVGAMDSSSYTLGSGTDGFKSFEIVGPADSTGPFTWSYFNVDGTNGIENNEIKGFYNGTALYTLELNDTGGYVFKMLSALPGSQVDFSAAEIKAGAPNTNSIDVGAVDSSDYVTIAAGGGAINESRGFVGVGNGNLDPGESLTLALHESDGTLIPFTSIDIGTKSAQASSYTWVATKVGGGTISGTENTAKNQAITISSADLQNFLIESITITKVSGPALKIGINDIHIFTAPDDVQLGFTVQLKDGDNDTQTASFVVDIDGNNDGNFGATVNSAVAATAALGFDSPSLSGQQVHHYHQADYLM